MPTIAGNSAPASPLAVDVWETARILSFSPFTVRNYIKDTVLKVSRLGRSIVTTISECQRLLHHEAASRKGAKHNAIRNI